jgi:hypothetical protein
MGSPSCNQKEPQSPQRQSWPLPNNAKAQNLNTISMEELIKEWWWPECKVNSMLICNHDVVWLFSIFAHFNPFTL